MSVMKCEGCVNHHVTMDVTNTGNWQRARQTGNEKWETKRRIGNEVTA